MCDSEQHLTERSQSRLAFLTSESSTDEEPYPFERPVREWSTCPKPPPVRGDVDRRSIQTALFGRHPHLDRVHWHSIERLASDPQTVVGVSAVATYSDLTRAMRKQRLIRKESGESVSVLKVFKRCSFAEIAGCAATTMDVWRRLLKRSGRDVRHCCFEPLTPLPTPPVWNDSNPPSYEQARFAFAFHTWKSDRARIDAYPKTAPSLDNSSSSSDPEPNISTVRSTRYGHRQRVFSKTRKVR